MVEEKWKPIKGYEQRYFVSNLGRFKNLEGHILKQRLNSSGYLQVFLYNETGKKNKLSHRLVALAFVKNQKNANEVNHIDGNKRNNCSSNLQWTTKSENHLHRVYVLGKTNKPVKKVKCVEKNKIYPSVALATKAMKLKNPICISNAANGKRKTARGYHWVFV